MLRDNDSRCYSSLLALLVLTVNLLLVAPGPSQAGSVEVGKEELQLRQLVPKLEMDPELLNEHGTESLLNRFDSSRRIQRSIGFEPQAFQIPRSNQPMELGILVDSIDDVRPKRYYEYGHMRFGKRGGEEPFNYYGHMRFGR